MRKLEASEPNLGICVSLSLKTTCETLCPVLESSSVKCKEKCNNVFIHITNSEDYTWLKLF